MIEAKIKSIWKLLSDSGICDPYVTEGIIHNTNNIYEKAIQELQGIAFATGYDNILSNTEIKMLLEWLTRNVHFSQVWPISRVDEQFMKLLDSGEPSKAWRQEMLAILNDIKAGRNVLGFTMNELHSIDEVRGKRCVVTGTFKDMSRTEVNDLLAAQGAFTGKVVSRQTDYLFVGSKGAFAWRFSGFGRKIEAALELRKQFGHLKICIEDNLLKVFEQGK